jgi:hypothetical protein
MYKKEWQVRLINDNGVFAHNVYITCEILKRTSRYTVEADGVEINFILGISTITIYG